MSDEVEMKRQALVRAIRADEDYLMSMQRYPEDSAAYDRELANVEGRIRSFKATLARLQTSESERSS